MDVPVGLKIVSNAICTDRFICQLIASSAVDEIPTKSAIRGAFGLLPEVMRDAQNHHASRLTLLPQ